MTYPIAYQLYSSRMFPPIFAHLPKLKAMGYTAIEPWLPAYEDDPKGFRMALDNADLQCFGFHFPAMRLFDDLERFIDYAKILGAKVLIPAYLDEDDRPKDAKEWKTFGMDLDNIAKSLARYDLMLAWHNHDFEFTALKDGSRGIDHLMAYDNIKLEIDLAWVIVAGASPSQELYRFRDKIRIVQMKDKRKKGDTKEFGFARPGKGVIDWAALLHIINDINPDHLVIEHDLPKDWESFASSSIDYLRKLGY